MTHAEAVTKVRLLIGKALCNVQTRQQVAMDREVVEENIECFADDALVCLCAGTDVMPYVRAHVHADDPTATLALQNAYKIVVAQVRQQIIDALQTDEVERRMIDAIMHQAEVAARQVKGEGESASAMEVLQEEVKELREEVQRLKRVASAEKQKSLGNMQG